MTGAQLSARSYLIINPRSPVGRAGARRSYRKGRIETMVPSAFRTYSTPSLAIFLQRWANNLLTSSEAASRVRKTMPRLMAAYRQTITSFGQRLPQLGWTQV